MNVEQSVGCEMKGKSEILGNKTCLNKTICIVPWAVIVNGLFAEELTNACAL
jgi:hypothetical protein